MISLIWPQPSIHSSQAVEIDVEDEEVEFIPSIDDDD